MILLRHGQSHFNVHFGATREDPGIVDADLTDEGRRQAAAAAEDLAGLDHVRRIIASPFSRTLHTADIVAERLKLPVEVEPLVHERAYFTCDIGSPRSQLTSRWPHFDFGELGEHWWPSNEGEQDIARRCTAFRDKVTTAGDWPGTLVVTHWGFIRGLTGLELGNAEFLRFDPSAAVVSPGEL